jgi:hypothetical protein
VLNDVRKRKQDKAKNTNTEISLSKRYKLFAISKFSSVKTSQKSTDHTMNIQNTPKQLHLYSVMHAKHFGRLTAMHSGRLTAVHSGRRNGSKILLSEPNTN